MVTNERKITKQKTRAKTSGKVKVPTLSGEKKSRSTPATNAQAKATWKLLTNMINSKKTMTKKNFSVPPEKMEKKLTCKRIMNNKERNKRKREKKLLIIGAEEWR